MLTCTFCLIQVQNDPHTNTEVWLNCAYVSKEKAGFEQEIRNKQMPEFFIKWSHGKFLVSKNPKLICFQLPACMESSIKKRRHPLPTRLPINKSHFQQKKRERESGV